MTINAVRSIGVTLATLMATTALAVTGGSSALAAPADPMTNSLVTLCTGSDDKRQDSSVALLIDTTNGTVRIVLSPDHQNIRLADNTCTQISLNLFPIRPTDITGMRLEWLRGTTDNTSPDSWWFTSLVITGLNTSAEIIELIDATGMPHKFEADEILMLRPPLALRGFFLGTITPPNQPPAQFTVDFVSFGGLVSATARIPAMLLINLCGRDFQTNAAEVTLGGRRVSVDADGTAHFELSGTYRPDAATVLNLVATLAMSPDGQRVAGVLTISLPWPCPDPVLPIALIKRG